MNDGILKNFPITFSKNKIKPFKKPHNIKFKLAPCHSPATDITNIKLKEANVLNSVKAFVKRVKKNRRVTLNFINKKIHCS